MLLVDLRRIIKSGFKSFSRNGMVSISSISVMVVALCVILSLMLGSVILDYTLNSIKDKVDINVYFLTDAPEENILTLKNQIENLSETQSVEYISREKSLENFKERHKNDELTLQALEELDDNPLGAVLNVKALQTNQYENIAKFLENKQSTEFQNYIDKVNYNQNKIVIDKLTAIIDAIDNFGLIISVVASLIAIAITFNTIRLAIFVAKDEISVMRLVGAGKRYIQGPFMTVGVLYGVVSWLITIIIFYPITYWLAGGTAKFFSLNIHQYYIQNFFSINFTILIIAILLGSISSFLAVNKYLKK